MQDRTRTFRMNRLAIIADGKTPAVLMPKRGRAVLHIVPLSAFSPWDQVDLARVEVLSTCLPPDGQIGFTPRFHFDGLVNVAAGRDGSYGYTQVFRNGCIEAVNVRLMLEGTVDKPTIASTWLRTHVLKVVPLYIDTLRQLEVSAPLVIMLTLEVPYGSILGVDSRSVIVGYEPLPILQERLELPEIVIDDYGPQRSYQQQLRPAFDALWNAGGYPNCGVVNPDGTWRREDL